MWGPRVSRPLLFLFHLPVTTPRWGRGATQAAPPMAAAPTVLAPADACHAARNRPPPSIPLHQTLVPPYKARPPPSPYSAAHGEFFPQIRHHQRREEGGEEGRRRRSGGETARLPWAPRSPGRRRHGAHPGAAGLLTVEGGAGGRERARGPRSPRRRPGATVGRHLRHRAGDLADRSRSCSQAPRLRRRAGNTAAPTSPALRPVDAPCCVQEVVTAMEPPYRTASSSSPRVAAVHLAHGVFDQMPVPAVERFVKSPMEP
jgi:hypothetical protein